MYARACFENSSRRGGGGGQGKETCLGGGRFVGGFISGNTLYFQPPTALYLCSFKQMFDRWLIRQATFCSWVNVKTELLWLL